MAVEERYGAESEDDDAEGDANANADLCGVVAAVTYWRCCG